MVMAEVQYCGVSDGIFDSKSNPVIFFSDPQTRRGRHVLAPRDPTDPASLPTLAAGLSWGPARRGLHW